MKNDVTAVGARAGVGLILAPVLALTLALTAGCTDRDDQNSTPATGSATVLDSASADLAAVTGDLAAADAGASQANSDLSAGESAQASDDNP